ncbi:hypothetical protein RBG61_11905 [Paludicola sp. MB14-C6]|uniref:hypothetical protein n=1 Tax=Paludihabitans sp. MB14-C6 TaxID=3070656 RepID=UPI0027DBABCD|nr:hypothetical protein [Paludicola sp. MB14-C6]WMJ22687.1 hypothetical protein RBG61_11905 [Paludicola sp. MB14-C6]
MDIRKTIRIDEDLIHDIINIAKDNNQTENSVIEKALKYYRDFYYMQVKSTFINDEIINILQAVIETKLQNINNKTNQVLSEVAIQSNIQNQVLASELDVNPLQLQQMRLNAIDFLKANNRVLKLNEIVE